MSWFCFSMSNIMSLDLKTPLLALKCFNVALYLCPYFSSLCLPCLEIDMNAMWNLINIYGETSDFLLIILPRYCYWPTWLWNAFTRDSVALWLWELVLFPQNASDSSTECKWCILEDQYIWTLMAAGPFLQNKLMCNRQGDLLTHVCCEAALADQLSCSEV